MSTNEPGRFPYRQADENGPDRNESDTPILPQTAKSGCLAVDVESIIKSFNIHIRRFDFDAHLPEEARGHLCGMCVTLSNRCQMIFLNTAMDGEQITLGHELQHAIRQRYQPGYKCKGGLFGNTAEERRCDRFARELAMPADRLLMAVATIGVDAQKLAEAFNVDAKSVRTRLRQLGLLKPRGRANR